MDANIAQTQPAETPVKPQKPWLKIVLFSVLGLVLASSLVFAGIQIGKKQGQKVALLPVPTPTPFSVATPTLVPFPTPTPDSTANWKTYTYYFDVFGLNLSFRYPNDWLVNKIESVKDGGGGGHPNFATVFSPDKTSCVKITVTSVTATWSLDEVLKSGATDFDASKLDNTVINSNLLTINGMSAKIREVQRDGKNFKDGVISMANDKRYPDNRVFAYLSSCSMVESDKFDQVLSTFKFLQ